jgi:hypothetical protein
MPVLDRARLRGRLCPRNRSRCSPVPPCTMAPTSETTVFYFFSSFASFSRFLFSRRGRIGRRTALVPKNGHPTPPGVAEPPCWARAAPAAAAAAAAPSRCAAAAHSRPVDPNSKLWTFRRSFRRAGSRARRGRRRLAVRGAPAAPSRGCVACCRTLGGVRGRRRTRALLAVACVVVKRTSGGQGDA